MAPSSVSSNPIVVGSRKGSIQALSTAASNSIESLPTPTSTASPGMAGSVITRAKAFDQRASSGKRGQFSPVVSPVYKSIEAQILVPQSVARPSASPSENSQPETHQSNGRMSAPARQLPRRPVPRGQTDTPPQPPLPDFTSGKQASRAMEVDSDEDHDNTPRQSASFVDPPVAVAVSRQDSSRSSSYTLKSRTYSPNNHMSDDARIGPTEPPRLPKLFFEGSIADEAEPALTSPKLARSLYSSPQMDFARAGWDSSTSVNSQTLSVPDTTHQGQIVDSPPADDELDAGNRSFFWHSPNDSTDEADDTEEEDNIGGFPSLSKRADTNSLTSATALGLGGPSDWEHFYGGDYETEDLIDDTELYLSKKERDKQKQEEAARATAIAAAKAKAGEEAIEAEETVRVAEQKAAEENRLQERPSLPTILETSQEEEISDVVTQELNYESNLEDFARSPPPPTPVTINGSPRGTGDTSQVAHKASSETIKRAEVKPSPKAGSEEQAVSATTEQQRPDSEAAPPSIKVTLPQPKTPPPPEIKVSRSKAPSTGNALEGGQSSPPVDDPNAEQITVSMVLPPDYDPRRDPQATSSPPTSLSSPPPVQSSRKSIFSAADEQPNPYAGLSVMAKASLNRYIKMLREEGKAESDQEKFYVFINFAQHEMKLRATLYDMDDDSEISLPPSSRTSMKSVTSRKMQSQPSLRSKPLPTPPTDTIPPLTMDPTTGRAQSMQASAASRLFHTAGKVLYPAPAPPPTRPPPPTPVLSSNIAQRSSEESFVVVDSPGQSGTKTPLPSTPNGRIIQTVSRKASLETLNKSIDLVAPRMSMISDPLIEANTSPQNVGTERQSNASSPLPGAQILSQSMSVKSYESRPYDGDKASNRQTIYRPFSGMLRSSSMHRRASMESLSTTKSVERGLPERKNTDPNTVPVPPLPEKCNHEPHTQGNMQPQSEVLPVDKPATQDASILEPLISIIPRVNILREESQQLMALRFNMDNIIDDFTFIHKTVLAWDSGAKIKREQHEVERQARISANERRVDELFNDNEIGYSDISQLEAEIKQSESAKKAEEEREEVESFVASVFDVVWARINYEMDQLTPLYQEATKLVAEASAGKGMFEETDERVPIAPIMDVLLVLYQKLMIRHQKAFEAVLERDRRLKKTEVSPWFAVGEFDEVKRIEKRFEDAEKKAVLEFCRQRDERANLLMDVLDQHTLRGVGANQDYMESVMQAVRKIAIQMATRGVQSDEAKPSPDEVVKAKFITIALARSSEQIVRTFHVADMLLNAADYEVSVANAKLSNADAAAFRRLREAKAKEDNKLAADLEHRLGLIRGDTERTKEEIAKLLTLVRQSDPDLEFNLARERDKRLIAALQKVRRQQEGQS